MRLIDADVFAEISKKHVPEVIENTWDEGYVECLKVVDETPTVNAIAIEFLEKWFGNNYNAFTDLMMAWEKENECNNKYQ